MSLVHFMQRLLTIAIAAAGIAGSALAQAASPAFLAKVNAAIDADAPRLTAIFKDLHQHPEIAFTEARTAGIVAAELKRLGLP